MSTFFSVLGFGIVTAAILAVGAAGLSLQFGVSNYINFAYGEFMTFGALLTWTLSEGAPHLALWLSVIIAVASTALLSLLVQRTVFTPFVHRRPQLLFALIVTFATSIILNNLMGIVWGTSYHELPTLLQFGATLRVGAFFFDANDALYFGLAVGAIILLQVLLVRTYLGKAMRAISDSATLASVCGIDVARVTDYTWLITGALAGLIGVLLAIQTHTFDITLGDTYLFLLFAAVIVGGIGKPYGALLGAGIVGIASQLSTLVLPSALALVGVFVILVAVLMVRPTGLLGSTIESAAER